MTTQTNSAWTEAQVMRAVNESCSCGGKGPDDGCCQACEVWHRLHGRKVKAEWPDWARVQQWTEGV